MTLQELLRSALEASGMSSREASTAAGLDPSTLSRWISGERKSPQLGDLLEVARVLKIPVTKLAAAARRKRDA